MDYYRYPPLDIDILTLHHRLTCITIAVKIIKQGKHMGKIVTIVTLRDYNLELLIFIILGPRLQRNFKW